MSKGSCGNFFFLPLQCFVSSLPKGQRSPGEVPWDTQQPQVLEAAFSLLALWISEEDSGREGNSHSLPRTLWETRNHTQVTALPWPAGGTVTMVSYIPSLCVVLVCVMMFAVTRSPKAMVTRCPCGRVMITVAGTFLPSDTWSPARAVRPNNNPTPFCCFCVCVCVLRQDLTESLN